MANNSFKKNIRLKSYDYKNKNAYFVTITTDFKKNCFGEIIDNKVVLNENGLKIKEIIEYSNTVNENLCYDVYVIMPNHIHCIIVFKEDLEYTISHVVNQFKGKCQKEIKSIRPLWRKGFYERVIRNENELEETRKYIIENPYYEKYHW